MSSTHTTTPAPSTPTTTRKRAPRKPAARKAPAVAPHDQTAITRRRDMALATAATWLAQGEDLPRVLSDLYSMAAANTRHDLGLPSVLRAA